MSPAVGSVDGRAAPALPDVQPAPHTFGPPATSSTMLAVPYQVLVLPAADHALRVLNFTVAAMALLLMAPLMLLIAVAIRVTSSGPALYRQERVGLDRRNRSSDPASERRRRDAGGRTFVMYKFRTMVITAEADGRAVWASRADARVTPLGRFLRAHRLDELPQLYNVLRGDMNVVGPRPERPAIFEQLRAVIPLYPLRQRVLPGITGWAQIHQCYDETLDDVRRKTAFDLEYLRSRSVAQDLRIMKATFPVLTWNRLGW